MSLLTELQAMRSELTGEIDGDSPAHDAKVTRWIDCVDRAIDAASELLQALEELSAMYTHAWDRVDGALTMMPPSVPRFEVAHEAATAAIKKARGE